MCVSVRCDEQDLYIMEPSNTDVEGVFDERIVFSYQLVIGNVLDE
jgi:hypothetical protein